MEIAKEMDVPHEDIIFALDAIQGLVSLHEPIFNDGGEPIYVMDQISADKVKEEEWDDKLSLKEGRHLLNEREQMILNKRYFPRKNPNGSSR